MSQLSERLTGLQQAIAQKEERRASGEKEPCTIDLIRADKEKALSIINSWRKNAVLYRGLQFFNQIFKQTNEIKGERQEMIIVARHQEGIGLNPLEYLLNEDGTEKEFESKESAIEFLKSAGASDDDIYYMRFLDAETGKELEE